MHSREDRREAGGREARAVVMSSWGSQPAGPERARRGGPGDGGPGEEGQVTEGQERRDR